MRRDTHYRELRVYGKHPAATAESGLVGPHPYERGVGSMHRSVARRALQLPRQRGRGKGEVVDRLHLQKKLKKSNKQNLF